MKYKCRKCGREFDIPATITYPTPTLQQPRPEINWPYTAPPPMTIFTYTVSVPCCPHCHSTDIEEKKET